MSRARGVFGLFLATTFGIINGIWVFGPAFKEQQEKQEKQEGEASGPAQPVIAQYIEPEKPLATGAVNMSPSSTAAALKPVEGTQPWWSNMAAWPKKETTEITEPANETVRTTKNVPT